MITAEILADTLNELGIDTKEKLVAFLTPAKLSTDLRQKEMQLEKAQEEHNIALNETRNAQSQEIATIQDEVETLRQTLKQFS